MSSVSEINGSSYSYYMDNASIAAGRAKRAMKVQGEAIMALIDSASASSSVSGANSAPRSTGMILDITA